MEKRTEEGRRRHELGKKIWYAKEREKQIIHEQNNGLLLGYPGVRISDYWKEKIERGETQILVVNGEMIPFRKKSNGYWFNNSNGLKYLHREKMRLYLGFTEEQMVDYDVHHIDGNKDNNDINNLKLLTKQEHQKHHAKILTKEQRDARRKNMNEKARPAAIAWHKSEAGRAWHKEQYKKTLGKK